MWLAWRGVCGRGSGGNNHVSILCHQSSIPQCQTSPLDRQAVLPALLPLGDRHGTVLDSGQMETFLFVYIWWVHF